jgi:hypothetical protein
MTRTQALTIITKHLRMAGDDVLAEAAAIITRTQKSLTVGDVLASAVVTSTLPRTLTTREKRMIAQSRKDFIEGRTMSLDECEIATDKFLAKLCA